MRWLLAVVLSLLAASATARAINFDVELGASHQSTPADGTWWQGDKPATFKTNGVYGALGVRGSSWSVEAADMGSMTSSAIACSGNEPSCATGRQPYAHWYGEERPRGLWAAWEPHYGRLFAQVGGGVFKPGFVMNIPDWNWVDTAGVVHTTPLTVGNNHIRPSYLIGFGYAIRSAGFGKLDLLVNDRWVYAGGDDTPGNFHALSKHVLTGALRVSF